MCAPTLKVKVHFSVTTHGTSSTPNLIHVSTLDALNIQKFASICALATASRSLFGFCVCKYCMVTLPFVPL